MKADRGAREGESWLREGRERESERERDRQTDRQTADAPELFGYEQASLHCLGTQCQNPIQGDAVFRPCLPDWSSSISLLILSAGTLRVVMLLDSSMRVVTLRLLTICPGSRLMTCL